MSTLIYGFIHDINFLKYMKTRLIIALVPGGHRKRKIHRVMITGTGSWDVVLQGLPIEVLGGVELHLQYLDLILDYWPGWTFPLS